MPPARLGKIKLRWCERCNVPLIGERCSTCGSRGFPVDVTPPGDVRPAFEFDVGMMRGLVDGQFGEGCGKVLLPDNKVFLLNRAPAEDRMDEIIVDGRVVGALRYEMFGEKPGFRIILRMEGALRIGDCIRKSWVVVDEGAVPSVLKSSNVMVVGITDIAEGIEAGDEVVVLSPQREVIAVGRSMMSTEEMRSSSRGVGIKVRWRYKEGARILDGGQTWDHVLRANEGKILRNIERAVKFLRKSAEKYGLPVVVSYSGGKDSLASLLLSLDAGLKPKMMFLNTGIELPETVENARKTAEKYSLELEVIDAGDAFWHGLKTFGPPAKDYRWCCKACKLGPTTLFIKERYPEGMLSIIGQRRYESESRARKGNEWENPWVRGQIGISPIQNWSALEVWLYLFYRKAEWNPWYERGLHRIGCYLCPSADMGDAEIVKRGFPGYRRWEEYLERYARERDLGDEWVKYGLWRWKGTPKWLRDRGFEMEDIRRGNGVSFSGTNPIVPSVPLNPERVRGFVSILGKWEESDGKISVEGICTIAEDSIEVIDEKEREDIKKIIEQAVNCIGCGVCVGRCPTGALSIKDRRAYADPNLCVACRECLKGPCPARDFNPATS